MVAPLKGYRKFIVALAALLSGTLVAMTQEAAVVSAWGFALSAITGAYLGAHAIADSKWSNFVSKP